MTELFRLKLLEWKWFESGTVRGFRVFVEVPGKWLQVFQVYEPLNNYWSNEWVLALPLGSTNPPNKATSPEEGKQLAEQHWQEYIKQALVHTESKQ